MSYRTFDKYLNLCLKKGYIRETKGSYQAIKLTTILQNLKLSDTPRYLRFFHRTRYNTKKTFKSVYEQIQDSMVLMNLEQQRYNIKKKQSQIDAFYLNSQELKTKKSSKSYRNKMKGLVKDAAKEGVSTEKYIKRIKRDKESAIIRTGKNHIAKIVGVSSSTGTKILKRLSNKVKRTIVVEDTGIPSYEDLFSITRKKFKGTIIPTKKNFVVSKGSVINLETNYIKDFYSYRSSKKLSSSIRRDKALNTHPIEKTIELS